MSKYHKIHGIWKRTDNGLMIPWDWSREEFGYLSELGWTWTEKVDGTNIRIEIRDGIYRVAGRTDKAEIPTSLLESIENLGLREKLLENFDGNVTLYGEGYGAKIQKGGGNYRQDQGFVLFDVRVGNWWLRRLDVEDLAAKLCIDVVPVVGFGSLFSAIEHVGHGQKSTWGDFMAEGLVCRPLVELSARNGQRIICKIKTRDFERLRNEQISW